MSATPRRVVLDCDPGHDDAMAILLAAAHPAVDLRAITTVAGNQTLDRTTLNARRVCSVAGITGVPIAAGCERPIRRQPIVAAEIHGASGLDGVDWPEPTVPVEPRHAVDVILDEAADAPDGLTLVAVGPLTNVATALERDASLAGRLARISVMGGAIGLGNWTPSAEFNIVADPEADADPLRQHRLATRSQLGRFGTPEEVVHVVLSLLDAAWATGEVWGIGR